MKTELPILVVDDDPTMRAALKEAGIRASWFLQLGYPGETWNEIAATRELIREERPSDVGVSVAYPLLQGAEKLRGTGNAFSTIAIASSLKPLALSVVWLNLRLPGS